MQQKTKNEGKGTWHIWNRKKSDTYPSKDKLSVISVIRKLFLGKEIEKATWRRRKTRETYPSWLFNSRGIEGRTMSYFRKKKEPRNLTNQYLI